MYGFRLGDCYPLTMPLAVATSWCSTRCSSSCARWARPRAAPLRPSKLSGLTASTDREVDSLDIGRGSAEVINRGSK